MLLKTANDPVAKALWYIESHFGSEISLEAIAQASRVSRYHLSRAFGAATGHSVMQYVRGRRLTEAARLLCAGAPDILAVAVDAGYGSHEAFTRAFREQFGRTPETVRAQRHLDDIAMLDAIRREEPMLTPLENPRIEIGRRLLIAGLPERDCQRIPFLWQRFAPYINTLTGQTADIGYGVRANSDDEGNFEYIAGVEVGNFEDVPAELTCLRIPEHRYAVFVHREHVSAIRNTFEAIWTTWLPQSDFEIADAPDFERYGEDFDPRNGTGNIEIWIPVKQRS